MPATKSKVTAAKTVAAAASDPGPISIPHERLMAAVVNELARSRIRHRALLHLLEERGLIEIAEYVKQYRSEEEQDFKPFVELLLLSPDEFKSRWSEWMEDNAARYGYDGSSRVNVQLAGPMAAAQKATRKSQGRKKK